MTNKDISQEIMVFHGRHAPEAGTLIGYGSLISHFNLPVPMPQHLALVSKKNRRYTKDGWNVFGPRYQPAETLTAQLTFALKYEGINLLFFKKLFEVLSKQEVVYLLQVEYTSQYMRRIWFLYEWLRQEQLPIPNLSVSNFVPLLDEKLQYAISNGTRSSRHRIINNLPGTVDFCPLIYRTEKLENFFNAKLNEKISSVIKDVLRLKLPSVSYSSTLLLTGTAGCTAI